LASWIVHLRVAESLLSKIDLLDDAWFAMGNIAPDSGIPDEKWENFDPPAHVLHFENQSSAAYDVADLDFYRQHLTQNQQKNTDPKKFSFLLGYFCHLVVDNLWSLRIGKPTQEKWASKFNADNGFIWEVKRDWYGLDFIYVRDHPNSIFWRTFLDCKYSHDFLDFLPPEAVNQRISYIKELYQRTDDRVQEAYKRPFIYLKQEGYNAFTDEASNIFLAAYVGLFIEKINTNDYLSILEIYL